MKRVLFVVCICVLFALPLATAPVQAGHVLVGNRTDYCSPCDVGGPCICDEGEQPGAGLVTEASPKIARPESKVPTVLVITLLLAWLGFRFRA